MQRTIILCSESTDIPKSLYALETGQALRLTFLMRTKKKRCHATSVIKQLL